MDYSHKLIFLMCIGVGGSVWKYGIGLKFERCEVEYLPLFRR